MPRGQIDLLEGFRCTRSSVYDPPPPPLVHWQTDYAQQYIIV